MRYRKLTTDSVDANGNFVRGGDMQFGHSAADFWINVPDAPAQAVVTRLRLQTNEWFLDRREGTPWKTQVLGKHTGDTRDPVVKFRTLGTVGVREILDYSSNLNRDTRAFDVNMQIDTVYGATRIEEPL